MFKGQDCYFLDIKVNDLLILLHFFNFTCAKVRFYKHNDEIFRLNRTT